MAIHVLLGEEQYFVTDPMLHGKPTRFVQHRANMVKFALSDQVSAASY